MIGTRSRAPKTTVRGDILLATLATREEEKRRTDAERRAAAKARQAQIAKEENLLLGETASVHNAASGETEEAVGGSEKAAGDDEEAFGGDEESFSEGEEVFGGGEGAFGRDEEVFGGGEEAFGEIEEDLGGAGSSGGEACAAHSTVQEPITLGGNVLHAEKQGRDYLLDPIPTGEACALHLQKCFPSIREMDTYAVIGKSKARRAKEVRFLKLSQGFVLRPPRSLLRRLLALHSVDVRELDQVVQHCLIVTANHRYHTEIWLAHLGRWMRHVLKSDEEGKAWLGRAVVKLRKQKQQKLREKKPTKKGRRAYA